MTLLVLVLTIAAYAAAALLRGGTRPALLLCALLGCQLAALLTPLWQLIYRYRYTGEWPAAVTIAGFSLPWPIVLGGWMAAIVPIGLLLLIERGWLRVNYGSAQLGLLVSGAWWLLTEGLASALGWWRYQSIALAFGLTLPLLLALIWGLISQAILSVLLLARRYDTASLALLLLPLIPLLTLLLGAGLGAPLAATLLLPQFGIAVAPWALTIATLGTLGLAAGAAHTAARVIAEQGRR